MVIRNRLFELYAMAPTAPLAPISTKKPPSAAESDPINRKDKLIEWRPSNRMLSNRTEPNRKPSISPTEPTESGQNRPIGTINHPGFDRLELSRTASWIPSQFNKPGGLPAGLPTILAASDAHLLFSAHQWMTIQKFRKCKDD